MARLRDQMAPVLSLSRIGTDSRGGGVLFCKLFSLSLLFSSLTQSTWDGGIDETSPQIKLDAGRQGKMQVVK